MRVDIIDAANRVLAAWYQCAFCLELRRRRDVDHVDVGQGAGLAVCCGCRADLDAHHTGRERDEPQPEDFLDVPAANDADAAE
jgi:hypothetical protein